MSHVGSSEAPECLAVSSQVRHTSEAEIADVEVLEIRHSSFTPYLTPFKSESSWEHRMSHNNTLAYEGKKADD